MILVTTMTRHNDDSDYEDDNYSKKETETLIKV